MPDLCSQYRLVWHPRITGIPKLRAYFIILERTVNPVIPMLSKKAAWGFTAQAYCFATSITMTQKVSNRCSLDFPEKDYCEPGANMRIGSGSIQLQYESLSYRWHVWSLSAKCIAISHL